MKRLLREPLLHFLLIGVALFAGYSTFQRGRDRAVSSKEIRLTLDDLAQLEMLFESQWRRRPTPDEFDALVENRIQEDILYREALAMGLDKDDQIVKRRMAQKMRFLAEDVAAAREPSDEELRAWFAEHGDPFALPPRIGFRHLYFSIDRRGGRARNDAAKALANLAGEPQDSERAASLADPFMFQDYYADATPEEIAREFGPEFARALRKLAPGVWQGPVESGFGWHLIFVDTSIPGRNPTFEEVEPDVRTAWLGAQKADAWQKAYAEMRGRYTVLLPVPPDGATASASEPARSADAVARDDGDDGAPL
jgi:peptidyl-prolyl cis-trans isomerase C